MFLAPQVGTVGRKCGSMSPGRVVDWQGMKGKAEGEKTADSRRTPVGNQVIRRERYGAFLNPLNKMEFTNL